MQHSSFVKQKSTHRIRALFLAFALILSYLLSVIARLSLFEYEKYRDKVYEQITTSSALLAERGNIYDRNMNLLATTKTVWRVFVSTKDIALYSKKEGKDYAAIIANGLYTLLETSRESLYKKMTGSRVLDVTLKKSVDENVYGEILGFINDHSLEKILFLEAQNSRYYPMGTTFAHVLGFVGSDNQGLYGLE